MSDQAGPSRGSDSATLVRGIGILIPGRFTGRAVAYGVQMVLARLLGPAGYGQFAIGWRILLIGGLLAALGLDNAVIRFGATYLREKVESLHALIRRSMTVSLMGGLAAAALLAAGSDYIANEVYGQPELRNVLLIFAGGLIAVPLLRVGAASTRVWQDMRYSVIAEDIAQPVAQMALVLLFHRWGMGVLGAAAAATLSFVLALALVQRYLSRLAPGFWRESRAEIVPTRELVGFALPTALAGTLSLIAMSTDLLLVGYFRSPAETGIYQAAAQISLLFAVLLTSFNVAFSPMIADLYHRGETERLNQLFRTSTRWGLILALPVFITVLIDPSGLLTLVMGPRYAEGATAMLILATGQMFNLATGAVGFLLVMSGRQKWWLGATGAAVVINIVLNLFLIPRFGIEGAAIATSVALLGLFGSGLIRVRRVMGLWPYDSRFLRVALAAIPAGLAVFGVASLARLSSPLRTLLELLVAGLVYWLAAGVIRRGALDELFGALRSRSRTGGDTQPK
jgi:O-antigen/teichoic acid export membrane protein